MNNSIYITGISGWLGRALEATFEHSEIHGLCYNSQEMELWSNHNNVQTTIGDIRNAQHCESFLKNSTGATLIHTAGIIHPNKISDFFDVNLEGTRNLMLAAKKSGTKRVVIVSSNSPLGCNPNPDHLFDEYSPYNPYMNYGKSKMLMELMTKEFAKQPDSPEIVIVRAPWFYGPYQPPRQTLFFKMIKEGKAPIVGSGNNLRSMSYIENLAYGIKLCSLVEKAKNKTYWISDEKPYSMNEIVDTIEKVLEEDFSIKCKHTRMRLPSIASDVAFAVDYTLQKLGLYHQKIHVLSEMNKTIAGSIKLAQDELGYDPKVSLREGMRRSIGWCLQNGLAI